MRSSRRSTTSSVGRKGGGLIAKRIWLVRHGKSARPFGVLDHDRPLAPRAGEDAKPIRGWLGDKPVLFVPSTARRAVDTARLIAGETPVRPRADLYVASPSEFLDVIEEELLDRDRVALIGHNPAITVLVNHLAGHALTDNVPTLGAAEFVREDENWMLADYVTPKALR